MFYILPLLTQVNLCSFSPYCNLVPKALFSNVGRAGSEEKSALV